MSSGFAASITAWPTGNRSILRYSIWQFFPDPNYHLRLREHDDKRTTSTHRGDDCRVRGIAPVCNSTGCATTSHHHEPTQI